MLLRTLSGAYAGQIRDYDLVAGRHALTAGTAELPPIDDGGEPVPELVESLPTSKAETKAPRRKDKR